MFEVLRLVFFSYLARNLFSIVVGAHSNMRGVGHSKGGHSNSMSSSTGLDNRGSSIGSVESGVDTSRVRGDTMDSNKGIGLTLDNMLNAMVLGDVFGPKGTIGLGSVVAGVVVAGDFVGDRSHRNTGSCVSHRGDSSRVESRVDSWHSGVSHRRNHGVDRVSSDTSMVDHSWVSLSISISLYNGMVIGVVSNIGAVRRVGVARNWSCIGGRSEAAHQGGAVCSRQKQLRISFRLSNSYSCQSENNKHLHDQASRTFQGGLSPC